MTVWTPTSSSRWWCSSKTSRQTKPRTKCKKGLSLRIVGRHHRKHRS
jgi:hypothetical protein